MINKLKGMCKNTNIILKISAISVILIMLICVVLIKPVEEKNRVSDAVEIDYTIRYVGDSNYDNDYNDAGENSFYKVKDENVTTMSVGELNELGISLYIGTIAFGYPSHNVDIKLKGFYLDNTNIKSSQSIALEIIGNAMIHPKEGTFNKIESSYNKDASGYYGIKAEGILFIDSGGRGGSLEVVSNSINIATKKECHAISVSRSLYVDSLEVVARANGYNGVGIYCNEYFSAEKTLYRETDACIKSYGGNIGITAGIMAKNVELEYIPVYVKALSEDKEAYGIVTKSEDNSDWISLLSNKVNANISSKNGGAAFSSKEMIVKNNSKLNISVNGKNMYGIKAIGYNGQTNSGLLIKDNSNIFVSGDITNDNIAAAIYGDNSNISIESGYIDINVENKTDNKKIVGILATNNNITTAGNVTITGGRVMSRVSSDTGVGIEARGTLSVQGGNVISCGNAQALICGNLTLNNNQAPYTKVIAATSDYAGTQLQDYSFGALNTYKYIKIGTSYEYYLQYNAVDGKMFINGTSTEATDISGWSKSEEINEETGTYDLILNGLNFTTDKRIGLEIIGKTNIILEEGSNNSISTVYLDRDGQTHGSIAISSDNDFIIKGAGTLDVSSTSYYKEGTEKSSSISYGIKVPKKVDIIENATVNVKVVAEEGIVYGIGVADVEFDFDFSTKDNVEEKCSEINNAKLNIAIKMKSNTGGCYGTYTCLFDVLYSKLNINIEVENSHSDPTYQCAIYTEGGKISSNARVTAVYASLASIQSEVIINTDMKSGIGIYTTTTRPMVEDTKLRCIMMGGDNTYGLYNPEDMKIYIDTSCIELKANHVSKYNNIVCDSYMSITEARIGDTIYRPTDLLNVATYDYVLIEPNYYLRYESSTGKMYINDTATEASVAGWSAVLDESTGLYTLVLDGFEFSTNNGVGLELVENTVIDVADNSENAIKISCGTSSNECAALLGCAKTDIQMGGKLDIITKNLGISTYKAEIGIYSAGPLSIKGKSAINKGSLNLRVGVDDEESVEYVYGINALNELIIKDASINDIKMKGKIVQAISASNNTITINNSKVHMPNLVSDYGESEIITAGKGMTVNNESDIYINYKDISNRVDGEYYENHNTIMYINEGELIVDKSDIKMDISMGAGTAIYAWEQLDITNSKVEICIDAIGNQGQDEIKGIYVKKDISITGDSTTIDIELSSTNDVVQGIYSEGGAINISGGVTVSTKLQGPTVYNIKANNDIVINGSTFTSNNNSTKNYGIYSYGGNITATNSSINSTETTANASATLMTDQDTLTQEQIDGGAIYAGDITLKNCIMDIKANSNITAAEVYGIYAKRGAIKVEGANTDIDIEIAAKYSAGIYSKTNNVDVSGNIDIVFTNEITDESSSSVAGGVVAIGDLNVSDANILIKGTSDYFACIDSEDGSLTVDESNIELKDIQGTTVYGLCTNPDSGAPVTAIGDITITGTNIDVDFESCVYMACTIHAETGNVYIKEDNDSNKNNRISIISNGSNVAIINTEKGSVNITNGHLELIHTGQASNAIAGIESVGDINLKNASIKLAINGGMGGGIASSRGNVNIDESSVDINVSKSLAYMGIVTQSSTDLGDNVGNINITASSIDIIVNTLMSGIQVEGISAEYGDINIVKDNDTEKRNKINVSILNDTNAYAFKVENGQIKVSKSDMILQGNTKAITGTFNLDTITDPRIGVVAASLDFDGSNIEGYTSGTDYKYLVVGEIEEYAYKYYPTAGKIYAYDSESGYDLAIDTPEELSNVGVSIINDGTTNALRLNAFNVTSNKAVALWVIGDAYIEVGQGAVNSIATNINTESDTVSDTYGIKAIGDIHISGQGTINLNKTSASSNDENYYGIYSTENIVIEEEKVNLTDYKMKILVSNSATKGNTFGIHGKNVDFTYANVSVQINEDHTSSYAVYANEINEVGKININDGGVELIADKVTNVVPTYTDVAITQATNSSGTNIWPGVVANTASYKYVLVQPNYYLNYNGSNGKMYKGATGKEANIAGWRTDASSGSNVLVIDGLNFETTARYGINFSGGNALNIADGSKNKIYINHFVVQAVHGINVNGAGKINGSGELTININNNLPGATNKSQYVKGIVFTGKMEIDDCKLNIDVISNNYKSADIYSNTSIYISGTELDLKAKSPGLNYSIYAYNDSAGHVEIKDSIITCRIEGPEANAAVKGLQTGKLENVQLVVDSIGQGCHYGFTSNKQGNIKNSTLRLKNDGGHTHMVHNRTNGLTIDNSNVYLDLDIEDGGSVGIDCYGDLNIINSSYIEYNTDSVNPVSFKCSDDSCTDVHFSPSSVITCYGNANFTGSELKVDAVAARLDILLGYYNLTIDNSVCDVKIEQTNVDLDSAEELEVGGFIGYMGDLNIINKSNIKIDASCEKIFQFYSNNNINIDDATIEMKGNSDIVFAIESWGGNILIDESSIDMSDMTAAIFYGITTSQYELSDEDIANGATYAGDITITGSKVNISAQKQGNDSEGTGIKSQYGDILIDKDSDSEEINDIEINLNMKENFAIHGHSNTTINNGQIDITTISSEAESIGHGICGVAGVTISGEDTIIDMNLSSVKESVGIDSSQGNVNTLNGAEANINAKSDTTAKGIWTGTDGGTVTITSSKANIYTGKETSDAIAIDTKNLVVSGETAETATAILEASKVYKDVSSEIYTEDELIKFPWKNDTSYKYVKIGEVPTYYYSYNGTSGEVSKVLKDGSSILLSVLPNGMTVTINAEGNKVLNLNGVNFTTIALTGLMTNNKSIINVVDGSTNSINIYRKDNDLKETTNNIHNKDGLDIIGGGTLNIECIITQMATTSNNLFTSNGIFNDEYINIKDVIINMNIEGENISGLCSYTDGRITIDNAIINFDCGSCIYARGMYCAYSTINDSTLNFNFIDTKVTDLIKYSSSEYGIHTTPVYVDSSATPEEIFVDINNSDVTVNTDGYNNYGILIATEGGISINENSHYVYNNKTNEKVYEDKSFSYGRGISISDGELIIDGGSKLDFDIRARSSIGLELYSDYGADIENATINANIVSTGYTYATTYGRFIRYETNKGIINIKSSNIKTDVYSFDGIAIDIIKEDNNNPIVNIKSSNITASTNGNCVIRTDGILNIEGEVKASGTYAPVLGENSSEPADLETVIDLETNYSAYKYVTIVPSVISVDITWGALNYKYNYGSWNTSTRVYDGRGWQVVDAEGNPSVDGDKISINNRSNVPVNASVTYSSQPEYASAITGKILTDKTSEILLMSPSQILVNGTQDTYLKLEGAPNSTMNNVVVGNVTVAITE